MGILALNFAKNVVREDSAAANGVTIAVVTIAVVDESIEFIATKAVIIKIFAVINSKLVCSG